MCREGFLESSDQGLFEGAIPELMENTEENHERSQSG
jgi:hypothetical protein